MNPENCWLFLSLVAANSAGKTRGLLEKMEPEEILELRGKDLYDYEIGVDLQEINEFDRWREPGAVAQIIDEMEKKDIRFVARNDPDFPEELMNLQDVPIGIYVKGKLPAPQKPKVSVIGSRRCSAYGKECAYFFGRELSKGGAEVVSGMALGVDGYAGSGAMDGAGRTTAVLGGGVDLCYPAENLGLYRSILDQGGCVISEKPPGFPSRPFVFPRRNRLISALGDCLAVIEAAERSGTRTTVEIALSLGKEIFAIPGRIGERMSLGCNALIKSGAHILTCPEDILQYLGLQVQKDTQKKPRVSLEPKEKAVWDLIGNEPVFVDDLMKKTGFPASAVLELLVRLEIKGLVRKEAMSGYVRVRLDKNI